jgi:hypothetical protein
MSTSFPKPVPASVHDGPVEKIFRTWHEDAPEGAVESAVRVAGRLPHPGWGLAPGRLESRRLESQRLASLQLASQGLVPYAAGAA